VERCLTAKLEDARDALINKAIELLGVYRAHYARNVAGTTLLVPESLRALPLLLLAMVKHVRARVCRWG
jgi:protein transport protein SEC24